jgi:hypothetical protein
MVLWNSKNFSFQHPEVINIGFLTLLFAGTIFICFKYYFLRASSGRCRDIVKILKDVLCSRFYTLLSKGWGGAASQKNKSAGNIKNSYGTSETLRNETVESTSRTAGAGDSKSIISISEHVPRHLKPITNEQFGHYLAGLIDGCGNFNTKQQLVIEFHFLDASLAYYIKKRVGFGSVKKIKDQNVFLLKIAVKKGVVKVIESINGKIRTENKYNQIINNILSHDNYVEFGKTIKFKCSDAANTSLDNHWLAGFSDALAYFQIKVVDWSGEASLLLRAGKEIRLNFKIKQKKKDMLLLIKGFLGGDIGYNKTQDTYNFSSTGFGSAKNVIDYFDRFHLLSSKHINYLKWRKAYLIIQNKIHLNKEGKDKIMKLKNSMNRCYMD